MKTFWNVLFDPDEHTCFTNSVYGTEVEQVHRFYRQFFCINPLLPETTRRDSNVTAFRNILLEFDKGNAVEQVNNLKEVPYSTLVWSGGKSHHAIISLETPCQDRAEYDALVRHIYAKLPMADKSVKNPSRLSRVPGVIRDNGNMQELLEVRSRVSAEQLNAWLGPMPENLKTEQPKLKSLHLSPWTKYFLMFGAEPGERNSSLFKAACDMLRHGYSQEDVVDRAQDVLELPLHEIRACVASAATAVRRGS